LWLQVAVAVVEHKPQLAVLAVVVLVVIVLL
jgi:hypothetical protein